MVHLYKDAYFFSDDIQLVERVADQTVPDE